MVEITKIESQKNKDKFNLFVDGQFYSGVLKETAIANNFFVGKKFEQTTLDKILLESESKQAFSKASDYLASRLHTRQELKLKLIKKGYDVQAVDLALDKLEEYGYIDDANFAEMFVSQNGKLSKQMIANKLTQKGVSREIVQSVLSKISSDEELEIAVLLTEKYLKNKEYKDVKDKLYAFLQRKGFGYETINKAINKVAKQDLDWEE